MQACVWAAMFCFYACIRILFGVMSNLLAAINLIWRSYVSVATSTLDLAATLITVRPS